MKRKALQTIIGIILSAAMLFALAGCGDKAAEEPVSAAPEVEEVPEDNAETAEAEESAFETIDMDALYAAFAPDETVCTINGQDIRWDEYFYWLADEINYIQEYMQYYAMYGYVDSFSWSEDISEEGEETSTYADFVISYADAMASQFEAIAAVASDNGIELGAEDEAAMQEQLASDIVNCCGEGATEDDFNAYLAENKTPRASYDYINRISTIYNKTKTALYGENFELVSDEDAVKYLEDNGYMFAHHILFLTSGIEDEAEVAAKLTQAETVAKELKAIKDPEALLKRFNELKAEYCEDGGKEYYPNGYLFPEGTMVTEFEDTVKALGNWQVSEPVQTDYGYHIIMKLPLDPDEPMYDTETSAREQVGTDQYGELLMGRIDIMEVVKSEKLTALNLLDYVAA